MRDINEALPFLKLFIILHRTTFNQTNRKRDRKSTEVLNPLSWPHYNKDRLNKIHGNQSRPNAQPTL